MARQHYFVVYGEKLEDGSVEFSIDQDTCDSRFSDGTIWDESQEEWFFPNGDGEPEEDASMYSKLAERLRA